jgi:hypothetical protein
MFGSSHAGGYAASGRGDSIRHSEFKARIRVRSGQVPTPLGCGSWKVLSCERVLPPFDGTHSQERCRVCPRSHTLEQSRCVATGERSMREKERLDPHTMKGWAGRKKKA